MKLSHYNFTTKREAPADADSVNAALLTRGRFIEKSMAGVYNFLPLGWMVMEKITKIVRKHMNATGAMEARFVTLQDKNIWAKTGRWDTAKEIMYQFKDQSDREIGLGFSHEEVFVDLLSRQPLSYNDFPTMLYQFQTKFRHEARAKSGLLRGREFIMKDLYSAHTTAEDLDSYYEKVAEAYLEVFKELGVPAIRTKAAGGVFTTNFTDEFQVISSVGEDTIYICDSCNQAINEEVFDQVNRKCPICDSSDLRQERSIEVGNIFNMGTLYSEKMGVLFTDHDGTQKPFYLASYGIGISRAMATIVELHHDDKGVKWPKSVAPFDVHLVGLSEVADTVYHKLVEDRVSVLYDDRDISAGTKFADADLLGMPVRLVVGNRTPVGQVEWLDRVGGDSQLVDVSSVGTKLASQAV